jgi:hypothetical protein
MCPICGVVRWSISPDFAWRGTIGSDGKLVGGDYHPFVVLTCGNCGHVILFNAVVMGLLPTKKGE